MIFCNRDISEEDKTSSTFIRNVLFICAWRRGSLFPTQGQCFSIRSGMNPNADLDVVLSFRYFFPGVERGSSKQLTNPRMKSAWDHPQCMVDQRASLQIFHIHFFSHTLASCRCSHSCLPVRTSATLGALSFSPNERYVPDSQMTFNAEARALHNA